MSCLSGSSAPWSTWGHSCSLQSGSVTQMEAKIKNKTNNNNKKPTIRYTRTWSMCQVNHRKFSPQNLHFNVLRLLCVVRSCFAHHLVSANTCKAKPHHSLDVYQPSPSFLPQGREREAGYQPAEAGFSPFFRVRPGCSIQPPCICISSGSSWESVGTALLQDRWDPTGEPESTCHASWTQSDIFFSFFQLNQSVM